MTQRPRSARAGFSLIELSIVMGIVGAMLAGIWTVANTMREKQKISQSAQTVSELVLAVRSTYLGQAGIGATVTANDDFPAVMSRLNGNQVIPIELLHATTSSCGGVSTNFADSALARTNTACGSLRICGWALGSSVGCAPTAGVTGLAQYFAVDFEALDMPGCLGLIGKVSPLQPPGLVDVYINGSGVVNGGATLPVPRDWATTQCAKAAPASVQFVYRLRPPM